MANNYYEGTGLLIFNGPPVITPIIKALFGPYNLTTVPFSDHTIQISAQSEGDDTTWRAIGLSLDKQAALKLNITSEQRDDDGGIKPALTQLGERFCVTDQAFKDLLAQIEGDEHDTGTDQDAELFTLFDLAQWLNDGHNLKAITFEGCWRCDKMRLFEFGGDVQHIGKDFTARGGTSDLRVIADKMQEAFDGGGMDVAAKVADVLYNAVRRQLDNIDDPLKRVGVMRALANKLENDE